MCGVASDLIEELGLPSGFLDIFLVSEVIYVVLDQPEVLLDPLLSQKAASLTCQLLVKQHTFNISAFIHDSI